MKINFLKCAALSVALLSSGIVNAGDAEETISLVKKKRGSSSSETKGVVKMNLSSLVFRNFAFQAEYAFHKNMSGALGFSYILPYKIPSTFYGEGFTSGKLFGYSVTPEFRFYPGPKKEHQAPHGFYLAPYARYAKFIAKADYVDPVENINGSVSASYSGFGGGLMIGSQWIIGNHFSIDLFIVGGHYGVGKIAVEAYDPSISTMSEADKQDVRASFESDLGPAGDVTASVNGDYIKASVKAPFIGIRGLGLNLGFAF